jgi:hypothetical protein
MKSMQAYSCAETQTVWTGTIKRLLHRYLEHRNRPRALRHGCAENRIVARLTKDVVGAMRPSEN